MRNQVTKSRKFAEICNLGFMPNGAHADQRRERVYGPIHDELTGILATLDANATTSQLHDAYERIKREHIRDMIPRDVRSKIVQLYEDILPQYEKELVTLQVDYRNRMIEEIASGMPVIVAGNGTKSSPRNINEVVVLAGSAYWLIEGWIPSSMERELEDAFERVKARNKNMQDESFLWFFEEWKCRLHKGKEYPAFLTLRHQAISLIQEIDKEIISDLESEF